MDLIRVADILVDKIKKDYRDDIACVVIMGSYIYEDTHSRSDLDLFFVPKTERGKNLGKVFIIEEVGFDFWPISWERLERIANHEERITSIITEGRIMYYSSDEDLERFNQLKIKALDVSHESRFVDKAHEKLNEAYKSYFRLFQAKTLSEVRMHSMGIIFSITNAIALLNRTTVKRGRGKLKKEIMDMSLVPKDFSSLYDTVFFSRDVVEIKQAYQQLISNMEELISNEQSQSLGPVSLVEKLSGYYEELINFYNKIYHACEIGDRYTALFAAVELTSEIEGAFLGTEVSSKQLPDIVGAFNVENKEKFLELVHEHQEKFVELLQSKGIDIQVFRNFEELEEYMETL